MAGNRIIGIAVPSNDTIDVAGGLDSNNVVRAFKMNSDGTQATSIMPFGATALINSSANQANANAVATLTASTGKTAWLTGFECTASGSTAGSVVTVTVAGILGGTLNYTFVAPASVGQAASPLIVEFMPPLPASTTNTNIVVTLPALGAGNTNATTVAHGFLL